MVAIVMHQVSKSYLQLICNYPYQIPSTIDNHRCWVSVWLVA